MKLYRIYFMKCSYTSEYYVSAETPEDAVAIYFSKKGNNCTILSVEEVSK